jgi:hypothetical protein
MRGNLDFFLQQQSRETATKEKSSRNGSELADNFA